MPERPPSGAEGERFSVPLFPLPNVFLFPGCILPLHVFEPRYRAMIGDLLDGPGRLVMGTVLEEASHDLTGAPPVHPTAGLGEIGRHERLPDGRFLIWLIGLARVRINEIESSKLYRMVEASILHEVTGNPAGGERLGPRLREAIRERCNGKIKLRPDLPVGRLADLLLQQLKLPQSVMNELYSELSVCARAKAALQEHCRRSQRPPSG